MDTKISHTNKTFHIPNFANSFAYDVYFQLNQLNFKKANGPENIPNKFFNALASVYRHHIWLIYLFYETGKYSDILKQAKVIPIHKSEIKDVASNY